MKSMETMQKEMMDKAAQDGGYPRVVHVGMGVIALVRNKEEFERFQKDQLIGFVVGASVLVVGLLCLIGFVMYKTVISWA